MDRWERHERIASALTAGLEAIGLGRNPDDGYWLPSLNGVHVPDGVEDAAVIDYVLESYDLEIAAVLGDLAGEIFRIGCMGHGARPENVTLVVAALADALDALGADVDADAGLVATRNAFR